MKRIVLMAVAALSGLAPAVALEAQAPSGVRGQGYGAVVTLLPGTQQFAAAALPVDGGMANADLDNAGVANTLTANSLQSITTGMADNPVSSSQTTAEAVDVTILNGVITVRQVVGVASSYVNQLAATSSADGSMLLGLVVNGVPVGAGDVTPAPNTRIDLPGVGYVILNEQTVSGDGVTTSGITVNMIHVVLQTILPSGPLGGGGVQHVGDVIVGSAASSVSQ